MSKAPKEFSEMWEAKARPLIKQIGELLDGVADPIAGSILGSLVAKHIAAVPLPLQPSILISFMKMVIGLTVETNNETKEAREAKGKDWTVEFGDQVKEAMAEDPEAAELVTETISRVKNVMAEFEAGKFSSIEEAMESLGMERVSEDEIAEIREKSGGPRRTH